MKTNAPTPARRLAAPALALALIAAATATRPAAAGFIVTDLGTLGGTGAPQAQGLNASGSAVGSAYTGSGAVHAFASTGGTMTDLGTLTPGLNSTASAVNASGQVVGNAGVNVMDYNTFQTYVYQHAFSYTASTGMVDIGTLGGNTSYAYGVNGSGEVVGYSNTAGGSLHAFTYTATGGMVDLNAALGGSFSIANAVNDSGQVVGYYATSASHAFSYTATGGVVDLGTLTQGGSSQAQAVSSTGAIVGYASVAGGSHAFLAASAGSALVDLGTLGGSSSYAYGVNGSGEVVGSSQVAGNSTMHGFYYSASTGLIDLNTLIAAGSGWTITGASGVNDAGQITATESNDTTGQIRAVLLSQQVPEPSTVALLAVGTVLGLGGRLASRSRRRPAA